MRIFRKKILWSLTAGAISSIVPICIVACTQNERAKEFDQNRLALLAFANKKESKKEPKIDLQKYKGKIDIALELHNFRADVLWCLDAFEPPDSVSENNRVFKYSIENVNHILGTTKAEITVGIFIDGFVNSDGKPVQIETYTLTIDGFKSTPINHKHWIKRPQKDNCKICLTFNE